jgi:hypothetical protein
MKYKRLFAKLPFLSREIVELAHKQVVESYITVLDQVKGHQQTATFLTYQLTINTN